MSRAAGFTRRANSRTVRAVRTSCVETVGRVRRGARGQLGGAGRSSKASTPRHLSGMPPADEIPHVGRFWRITMEPARQPCGDLIEAIPRREVLDSACRPALDGRCAADVAAVAHLHHRSTHQAGSAPGGVGPAHCRRRVNSTTPGSQLALFARYSG